MTTSAFLPNYDYKTAEGPQLAAPYDRKVSEALQPVHEEPKYTVKNEDEPKYIVDEPVVSPVSPELPVFHTTTRNDSSAGTLVHSDEGQATPPNDRERNDKKRICGCPPLVFWIIAGLVILIIVGGALGGGLGGGLAAQKKDGSTDTTSSTTSSTITGSPSDTSAATSASASSSFPSKIFSLALYDGLDYGGTAMNLSTTGNYTIPFLANSYVWKPLMSDCCVTFCHDDRDVGWRCLSETYQPNSSVAFNRVAIRCGVLGQPPPSEWCAAGT